MQPPIGEWLLLSDPLQFINTVDGMLVWFEAEEGDGREERRDKMGGKRRRRREGW